MNKHYTDEKNVQVVISLLKQHRISKIIASPGAININLVASLQQDSYFEMYSSVDERSAAYMACGLAAESGEPVALSCTGATASRNYLPGLTEAFYRKLPILAITSSQPVFRVGHLVPQVLDRSVQPNDTVKLSVSLPIVKDDDDLEECVVKTNMAILELSRHGGGPVHINLPTTYSCSYDVLELPKFRVIHRVTPADQFPDLPQGKIAIWVGSHKPWTQEQTEALDQFCAEYDAVVFCDHTSGYKGKYRALFALVASQQLLDLGSFKPDLLISIGEISGDGYSKWVVGNIVWRVNEDGEIRDLFHKLGYIFEMPELCFFKHYVSDPTPNKNVGSYLEKIKVQIENTYNKIPDLPFSNIWIASQMAHRLPENSALHLGILNSLRSWNFFEIPKTVQSSSNVGGFGIDGGLSSFIGASLANKDKLFFCIIGDLAFFYDMNVMGNRHIGKNLRILLINNGKGTEFKNYCHLGAQFGDQADEYIAAGKHFGNKSSLLVKNYTSNLNFEYLSAANKEEFEVTINRLLVPLEASKKPIIVEVFTKDCDESDALKIMRNLEKNPKSIAKKLVTRVVGDKGVDIIKRIGNRASNVSG